MLKFKNITKIPAALALVILASCSDNEDIYIGGDDSIGFSSYVGRNTSRGAVVTNENLNDFGVFGYFDKGYDYANGTQTPNFMYNQQVSRIGDSWAYSPVKYWPSDVAEKVSFFAYAPYCAAASEVNNESTGIIAMTDNTDQGDPTLCFSVGTNVDNHIDLIYAKAVDQTNRTRTVNLEFKHALSRVGFNVIGWDANNGEFDDNTTVTINSVKLATTRREATLNLNTGIWSNPTESETLRSFTLSTRNGMIANNVIVSGEIEAKRLNKADDYIMMLPDMSGSDEYVLFVDYTVETRDANLASGSHIVRNNVFSRFTPHFEAGKAYSINIHLGMDGGGFPGGDSGPVPTDPDPDPENPVPPTAAGNAGPVRFSAMVVDWNTGEDLGFSPGVSIPNEIVMPLYAEFEDFNINASVEPMSRSSFDLTVQSLVHSGTNENALKEPFVVENANSFTISRDAIDYNKIEPGIPYVLTATDSEGVIYRGDITMDFAMMAFTIESKERECDLKFNTGLKLGMTMPAKVFIAWGDGTQGDFIETVTETNRGHQYEKDGVYQVRIFSDQLDPTLPQLCDYTLTERTTIHARQVISMDTPLLSNVSNDLTYMFSSCTRMSTIPGTLFINFPDVDMFRSVFLSCASLREIPEDLFSYTNGQEVKMSGTFQNCHAIKSIPENLFKNIRLTSVIGVFCGMTGLKNIPAGLFSNNIDIESFNGAFSVCSSLESVPAGLFANNLKAYDFEGTFAQDHKLVDFENIFISSEADKTRRFTGLTQTLNVNSMFALVGTEADTSGYNALNFNEYSIPSGITGKPYGKASTDWANYEDVKGFF